MIVRTIAIKFLAPFVSPVGLQKFAINLAKLIVSSGNFKRVFPTKKHFNDEECVESMTERNQIQMKWFKGKCEEDPEWC